MKEEFVTKNHFDLTVKHLDEKMDYLDEKIDSVLEAVQFGFEKNSEEHAEFRTQITTTQNQIDGYIKSREDSEQEATILKHRVDLIEEKVSIER